MCCFEDALFLFLFLLSALEAHSQSMLVQLSMRRFGVFKSKLREKDAFYCTTTFYNRN